MKKKTAFLIKFGKRLYRLRNHYQATQSEMAERAEVADGYYSDIERGCRNLPLMTVKRLAKAFGLSLEQLFDFSYLPEPIPIKVKRKKKPKKKTSASSR